MLGGLKGTALIWREGDVEKREDFFWLVGVTVVFLGSFTSKSPWQSMWRGFTLMLVDRDSSLVSSKETTATAAAGGKFV